MKLPVHQRIVRALERQRHDRASHFMIAVVDDSISVRRALIRLLQVFGYVSHGFASGAEFLRTWPDNGARCLILDAQMPGVSGVDVQRELNRTLARIPVIMITASDSPAMREKCMGLGACNYLSKPIHTPILLDAVARALSESSRVRDQRPLCDVASTASVG